MLYRILTLTLMTALLSSCELALFEEAESTGSVMLYWSAPQERVNGDVMDRDEIGGYEIRYRTEGSNQYETILITDASIEQYKVSGIIPSRTIFEVAVYDTDGIYSNFVQASEN